MVESFEPFFKTMGTDSQSITLRNTGIWNLKTKYAIAGTSIHTGSTGPVELREHKITDSFGEVLSSISGKSASIGCQKNITADGYYGFGIRNVSATTQTWNWTITF